MSDINIKGFDELQRFLNELPAKMERNVAGGAMRAAANVVKAEAQLELATHGSVHTAKLSKGLKVRTSSRGGVVTATLSTQGKHGFVANWLEFTGAVAHTIRARLGNALSFGGTMVKSVQHPGFKPKPFLRPALDARARAAFVAAGEYTKARLATKHGLDTADIEIGTS